MMDANNGRLTQQEIEALRAQRACYPQTSSAAGRPMVEVHNAEVAKLRAALQERDDYIRKVFGWTLDNTVAWLALTECRAAVVPLEVGTLDGEGRIYELIYRVPDADCGPFDWYKNLDQVRLDKPVENK